MTERRPAVFAPRACKRCAVAFVPSARANVFCPDCVPARRKEQKAIADARYYRNVKRRHIRAVFGGVR